MDVKSSTEDMVEFTSKYSNWTKANGVIVYAPTSPDTLCMCGTYLKTSTVASDMSPVISLPTSNSELAGNRIHGRKSRAYGTW